MKRTNLIIKVFLSIVFNNIRALPDVWVENTNLKRALHIDHEGDWEFVGIRL